MDGFADVREVKLPNKWNNGSEDVDVTSIGNSAFSECGGLVSVTISDGVTRIGDHAFFLCRGLMSVSIPDSVTSIRPNAFLDCNDSLYDMATIPGVRLVDGWAV